MIFHDTDHHWVELFNKDWECFLSNKDLTCFLFFPLDLFQEFNSFQNIFIWKLIPVHYHQSLNTLMSKFSNSRRKKWSRWILWQEYICHRIFHQQKLMKSMKIQSSAIDSNIIFPNDLRSINQSRSKIITWHDSYINIVNLNDFFDDQNISSVKKLSKYHNHECQIKILKRRTIVSPVVDSRDRSRTFGESSFSSW